MSEALDALLQLAAHDAAVARLLGRRESLSERAELAAARAGLVELDAVIAERTAARDAVLADEQRIAAEVAAIEERVRVDERRLYSGEITAPRDLQTLQGEIEQLRERRRGLEDEELEVMERREELDGEVHAEVVKREAHLSVARELANRLAALEAEIDAEVRSESNARNEAAAAVPEAMVKKYEGVRARTGGAGAARLVGTTCEGCHLSIPTTEAEAIRRAPEQLSLCDNCGRILIPA